MKNHRFPIPPSLIIAILGTILLISGCKKEDDNPVAPPPTINTAYLQTAYGFFPLAGNASVKGILATFNARAGSRHIISTIGMFFGGNVATSVYGGMAFVNSNIVDTITSFGTILYSRPNSHISAPLDNVAFDGSFHHWRVFGSDSIPPFADSVASPDGPADIQTPAEEAGIALDAALSVTWDPATTDSVLVIVSDMNGKLLYSLGTGSQATFGTSQISGMAAGVGHISLIRYRHTLVATEKGNILLLAISSDDRDITFYTPEF
jgi:hypothetical protein